MQTIESKKYELRDLTQDDINLIGTGLGQLQYIKSFGLINRIAASVDMQNANGNKKEETSDSRQVRRAKKREKKKDKIEQEVE